MVSKAFAESSNFGENKTELLSRALMLQASCIYLGLIAPCPKPPTYKCHLNQRLPKTSCLTNVSLIASTTSL